MSAVKPRIDVFDTTLRDGCQGEGVKFEVADKLAVTQKLADVGVDYVECGFPYANDTDKEFFRQVQNLRLGGTKLVAFGTTRLKDVRAEDDLCLLSLLTAETEIVSLVGKASAVQVRDVLGLNNINDN